MYLIKRNKVKYEIVVSKFPRKVKPITGLSINPDFSFFDAFLYYLLVRRCHRVLFARYRFYIVFYFWFIINLYGILSYLLLSGWAS